MDSRPIRTEAVGRFVAAHGENWWPSAGTFDGRQWGDSHGRRHATAASLGSRSCGALRADCRRSRAMQTSWPWFGATRSSPISRPPTMRTSVITRFCTLALWALQPVVVRPLPVDLIRSLGPTTCPEICPEFSNCEKTQANSEHLRADAGDGLVDQTDRLRRPEFSVMAERTFLGRDRRFARPNTSFHVRAPKSPSRNTICALQQVGPGSQHAFARPSNPKGRRARSQRPHGDIAQLARNAAQRPTSAAWCDLPSRCASPDRGNSGPSPYERTELSESSRLQI